MPDRPPVSIRPCEQPDIAAIAALYGEAVRYGTATFEIDPPDEAEMTARFRTMVEGGYPYLVAEVDGAFAGYAYAGAYRARPAYRGSVENSVYVVPGFQRRAVGTQLLTTLVDDAAQRGFRQMIAVIGDSANAGSIGLHARCGFAHAGVLRSVGWKHGQWLDTVLMQRALGSGDGEPFMTAA